MSGWVVSVGGEYPCEFFVCNLSGLWKAVHAAYDFDQDVSPTINEVEEIVLVDDALGNFGDMDLHEFRSCHWCP